MSSPTDNIDTATDAVDSVRNDITDTVRSAASDASDALSDVVGKTGNIVTDTITHLRTAYEQNPARTIAIAALSIGALIAVITRLARRD